MPKFKIGDVIVTPRTRSEDGLNRTVIGHMSNGYVVYEYVSIDGNIRLGSAAETGFKLKPVKKEGWINIYPCRKVSLSLRETEAEAKRFADDHCIATVKVEWEE